MSGEELPADRRWLPVRSTAGRGATGLRGRFRSHAGPLVSGAGEGDQLDGIPPGDMVEVVTARAVPTIDGGQPSMRRQVAFRTRRERC